MTEQWVAHIKSVLRPVAKHRFLIERAKFISSAILAPEEGNELIGSLLTQGKPAAIGKFGESELGGLKHWFAYRQASGRNDRWGIYAQRLYNNAGVYPADAEVYSRFCDCYARAAGEVDVLAVWFQFGERRLQQRVARQATLVAQTSLEPFFHQRPWSAALAGKRVLVVSPFAETIFRQYPRRADIWKAKPQVLPEFALQTLRCPMSAGVIGAPEYPDWFAGLEAMKQDMTSRSFDAAIIGAGAWSLPLAAHAKQMGKFAIHLGGPTQLLFGIRGGRWDGKAFFKELFNDAWVRPGASERPPEFKKIENGCYW